MVSVSRVTELLRLWERERRRWLMRREDRRRAQHDWSPHLYDHERLHFEALMRRRRVSKDLEHLLWKFLLASRRVDE
jgi:hypothetical protein